MIVAPNEEDSYPATNINPTTKSVRQRSLFRGPYAARARLALSIVNVKSSHPQHAKCCKHRSIEKFKKTSYRVALLEDRASALYVSLAIRKLAPNGVLGN